MINLEFHYDAAHGWIKIPIKDLYKLKIADKISHYSYIDTKYVYLEEDQDANTLIEALRENKIDFKVLEHNDGDYSPIRNKNQFIIN
jgi:hypothetical protein